ncbi:MAG: site-specific integrase [Bacilli bacterium]|nr:site-specific integrase [Bacilli bacterium]
MLKPNINCGFREYRTYVIVNFLLATGCRVGTLINIKVNDVDLKNKEVTYRHLKTKELAIIPLSNAIVDVLKDYFSVWELKSDYLFCSVNNKKMTRNSVRLSLEDYCNKRGIKSRGIHAFRHTFARCWILNNGNVFSLQHMLCHSDLTMTKKYVKIFGSDLHKDLEQYNPLDNFKSSKVVRREVFKSANKNILN